MTSHTSNDPTYWRERAALIRAIAITAKDQETFDLMSDLAGDCEKLGDKAARRVLANDPKGGRNPK
jgi:hypothetical protein